MRVQAVAAGRLQAVEPVLGGRGVAPLEAGFGKADQGGGGIWIIFVRGQVQAFYELARICEAADGLVVLPGRQIDVADIEVHHDLKVFELMGAADGEGPGIVVHGKGRIAPVHGHDAEEIVGADHVFPLPGLFKGVEAGDHIRVEGHHVVLEVAFLPPHEAGKAHEGIVALDQADSLEAVAGSDDDLPVLAQGRIDLLNQRGNVFRIFLKVHRILVLVIYAADLRRLPFHVIKTVSVKQISIRSPGWLTCQLPQEACSSPPGSAAPPGWSGRGRRPRWRRQFRPS